MGLYNDVKPVAATSSWNDRTLHHLKRELSRLEKRRLRPAVVNGKAVVMPGCPNTEVEELLSHGFDPRNIFAIESEQSIADALYDHYWDQINVHWEEIGAWLQRARNSYSYIHLDYCGHLKDRELEGIEYAYAKLAPQSHFRISTLISRRGTTQVQREIMITERILGPLVEVLSETHPSYEWNDWYQSLRPNLADSTIAIAAIVIMNAFFGINWYEYTDTCAQRGAFVPNFEGAHRIVDIARFQYSENGNGQVMNTVWFSLDPSLHGPSRNHLGVEGLAVALQQLTKPITLYTNPSLYH